MINEAVGDKVLTDLLSFLALAERLKTELRHSWLSSGRRESVAEHCWMMSLMAMLVAPHLDESVDIARTLQIIIVHDIAETKVGDIPFFEVSERKNGKQAAERRAMAEISSSFSDKTGQLIQSLWQEFEDGSTAEGRLARALDHLEVQHQHNVAPIETWEDFERDLIYTKMDGPCRYDRFLSSLVAALRGQAESKLLRAGVDVDALRKHFTGSGMEI